MEAVKDRGKKSERGEDRGSGGDGRRDGRGSKGTGMGQPVADRGRRGRRDK